MKYRRWIGVLSIVLGGVAWTAPGMLQAASNAGDGYTIEDLELDSAGDLVDVCTIETGHPDHDTALAFCYGFFEGAFHYDDAISASSNYIDLVCSPPGTTQQQAVEVFLTYMEANPRYYAEQPIDALFRALVAQWPCSD